MKSKSLKYKSLIKEERARGKVSGLINIVKLKKWGDQSYNYDKKYKSSLKEYKKKYKENFNKKRCK